MHLFERREFFSLPRAIFDSLRYLQVTRDNFGRNDEFDHRRARRFPGQLSDTVDRTYHEAQGEFQSGKASAGELAALYHERWEIATASDELKIHLHGAQIVLRSKTPEI
jgi:IS4 transposase